MALSRTDRLPLVGINEDPIDDDWSVVQVVGPHFDFRDMVLRHASPSHEITENDDTYQISIRLPGVLRACDMRARLEYGGSVLHISGGRKIAQEGRFTETCFDKRFTIGRDVDTTKLTANLADGVLTLAAPKKTMKNKHHLLEADKPTRILITAENNNSGSSKARKTKKWKQHVKLPFTTKRQGKEWGCCNALSYPAL